MARRAGQNGPDRHPICAEIALRSKVGYHLGLRDKFGHLDSHHLDGERASASDTEQPHRSRFDVWVERFLEHQERAGHSEDFIKHYVEKYDGHLPIWVATEVMEFGQLVRLYGFMADGDRSKIAAELAQTSGAVLVRWMPAINYLRNASAHHARLTYKIATVPETLSELLHLNEAAERRSRVYGACAVLAQLTPVIRPEDRWAERFVELMDSFPAEPPVSPEIQMGFPAGWRELELWRR